VQDDAGDEHEDDGGGDEADETREKKHVTFGTPSVPSRSMET
jgi:hypothetical protein